MARRYKIPEGLKVAPDGSWQTGEQPVVHQATLRYLKAHLRFEDEGAFIVDGGKRMSIEMKGPPFEVLALELDAAASTAKLRLDDGSEEEVGEETLAMDEESGRIECRVRRGRGRAMLSRGAHQTLLDHAVEADGEFYLACGERRYLIRT
jgi:hypothetical protein